MITTIKEQQYFKYSMLSYLEQSLYYDKIYKFVSRLVWEYPGFKQWYAGLFDNQKQLDYTREIIICEKDFNIAGIAILKNDECEKKICTLRVAKEYQKQGIGSRLMELSFEWLQEDSPMITMHKIKQVEFQPLLDYYGFKLEQKQRNYYNVFSTELVYNGALPEKELIFNKIELLDIQKLYKKFMDTGKYNFNEFLEECIRVWQEKECYRRIEMLKY